MPRPMSSPATSKQRSRFIDRPISPLLLQSSSPTGPFIDSSTFDDYFESIEKQVEDSFAATLDASPAPVPRRTRAVAPSISSPELHTRRRSAAAILETTAADVSDITTAAAPSQPTPSQPTPSQLTPSQAMMSQTTPLQSTPIDQTPSQATPPDPTPPAARMRIAAPASITSLGGSAAGTPAPPSVGSSTGSGKSVRNGRYRRVSSAAELSTLLDERISRRPSAPDASPAASNWGAPAPAAAAPKPPAPEQPAPKPPAPKPPTKPPVPAAAKPPLPAAAKPRPPSERLPIDPKRRPRRLRSASARTVSEAVDDETHEESGGGRFVLHPLKRRQVLELYDAFKAQHRDGVCKVPRFDQLLRLTFPTEGKHSWAAMLEAVGAVEAAIAAEAAASDAAKRDVDALFTALDLDGKGTIDMDEFLQVCDLPVTSPSCDLPMTTPSCDLPVTSPSCDLPVTSPSCDLPMTSPSCDLPMTSPSVALISL